jgi:hypothetical protein
MVDPILISIATTLATKAAGSLYDLVKSAFHRHPKAAEALEAANGAAPESAPVQALAERLAEVEAAEPAFREQLRTEWAKIEVSQRGGVNNLITGNVTGKVVQARDITGDINF